MASDGPCVSNTTRNLADDAIRRTGSLQDLVYSVVFVASMRSGAWITVTF